jgi:hypothetical protein
VFIPLFEYNDDQAKYYFEVLKNKKTIPKELYMDNPVQAKRSSG